MRMLVLLPLQPQRSRQPVSARLSRVAVAAATAALGCRESTVTRGSSAQHSAARSDVTWAMCNARRFGPRERSEQGPRRRALHIAQVTSGILQVSLPPKYRRCLYEMAKEVYHYGSPKQVTYEQVLQTIFFCSSLRILHMAYLMAVGYPDWYAYRHDVMLSFCRLNAHRFDYSLMVAIYLFNVVYTSLEYWIYHIDMAERVAVWKWWWQALVLNQQQFYQCQLNTLQLEAVWAAKRRAISAWLQSSFPLLSGAFREPLANLLARWQIFYNLENVDIEALKNGGTASLPIRPQMSWTLRRQSLRILLITDQVAFGFQLFVVFIYWLVIALVVISYPNWSGHSVLGITWVSLEVSGAFYVLMRLVR
ncbi:hypothetical protein TYRP_015020 [Tyrophagus putrescentiae]|nr:hypothetical protein TYRP_015020 [Tyrophagus putrescentiae]